MRLHFRRQKLVRYMVFVTHQEYLDYPLDYMQSAETHRPMASVTLTCAVLRVPLSVPYKISLSYHLPLGFRGPSL